MTYLVVSNDSVRLTNAVLDYAKQYHPGDVFWVKRPPDKKEITVDLVNTLVNQANLAAVSGKKLFIIFEAELLNVTAQNKLLKTIEDTDDSTLFLFLCQNLNYILPTIKSRAIIRYYQPNAENLTLKQLSASNPDSAQIYHAATQLLRATDINQAISLLPVLAKPENLTLALDALNQATKAATLPANKKLTIYRTLAQISRNVAANCNPNNTFDWLLLSLFQ